MKKDLKINLMFIMIPLFLMLVVVIGVTYALFTQDIETGEVITLKTGEKYVGIYGEGKDNILLNKDYTFTIENRGNVETGYEVYLDNTTDIDLKDITYTISGDESSTGTLESEKLLVGNIDIDEKKTISFKVSSDKFGDYAGIIKVRASDYKVNEPEVVNGMIPVTFDGTNWIKTDIKNTNNEWYDYASGKWANVVTIKNVEKRDTYGKAQNGKKIEIDDINSFFVWIPRYSYTLQGNLGLQLDGASTVSKETPGAFDIKFVSKNVTDTGKGSYTGFKADEYYTPVGFCSGATCTTSRSDAANVELDGIWVSKFELTGSSDEPSSIPNVESLRNLNVSSLFNVIANNMNGERATTLYGFSGNNYNSHMVKNSEWSLLSYLTQSKYGKYGNDKYDGVNKEVYQNKSENYITGCSTGVPSNDVANYECTYRYGVDGSGTGASSTGTIYGVYDLSGGADEYVMANLNNISGAASDETSGFNGNNNDNSTTTGTPFPSLNYIDNYQTIDATTACGNTMCKGQNLIYTKNWYNDNIEFVTNEKAWLTRGASYKTGKEAGIFNVSSSSGKAKADTGTRAVIIAW